MDGARAADPGGRLHGGGAGVSGDRILLAELSAELARSPFGRSITISRKCARAIERALLRDTSSKVGQSVGGAVPKTVASVRPVARPADCEVGAPEGTSGWHRDGEQSAVCMKPAKAPSAHATVSRSAGGLLSPAGPPGQPSTLPPVSQAAPVVSVPLRRAVPVAERIDLSTARSGLEARFDRASSDRAAPPAPGCGKVSCGCYPEGLVPEWFGRDCIEPRCGLKERAA